MAVLVVPERLARQYTAMPPTVQSSYARARAPISTRKDSLTTRMRIPLNLTTVLLLLALLIACDSGSDTPTPTPTPSTESVGGEEVLTLLYWQAPSLPGPYLSGGYKDRDAGAVTLEPFAVYDPDGNLVPALATGIPTLENGGVAQDLMSITWTLQEGLQWSDGSPVTANDAVFTWRYCTDHDTGCTAADAFEGIASVEALDALMVRISFDAPTPNPYNAFVTTGTPIISEAQFADCIGAAATTCDAQNNAPLGLAPIASPALRPTQTPSTSATRSTVARRPTSIEWCSRGVAMPFRRPAPSWRRARPITPGTCR